MTKQSMLFTKSGEQVHRCPHCLRWWYITSQGIQKSYVTSKHAGDYKKSDYQKCASCRVISAVALARKIIRDIEITNERENETNIRQDMEDLT
jgi:hypothetical protein